MEPEVKFRSIGIISDELGEIDTPLPVDANQSGRVLFTLKEGSQYRLKLTFSVLHNIVSGLTYSNTVRKAGLQGAESLSQFPLFRFIIYVAEGISEADFFFFFGIPPAFLVKH